VDANNSANDDDIESCIKSCNYNKTKKGNLQRISMQLAGKVFHNTFNELSIGPKIANLILSVAFKRDEEGNIPSSFS